MNPVLAIDIGGSKMMAGYIASGNGEIIESEKLTYEGIPTKKKMLEFIRILTVSLKSDISYDRVGITIPGLCDPKKGIWRYAPFSGIRDFDIAGEVQLITGKPVEIENDVNACAIAEKMFGCCRSVTDFLWVTVSNGCGGSVFINDKLYTGAKNGAGEIGHVCVDYETDVMCGCGNKGCFEAMASGVGIGKRYCSLTQTEYDSSYNGEFVASMAKTGDENAAEVMAMTGVYIGRALAAAVNILNPAKIVIGGGVSQSLDMIMPDLMKEFEKHLFKGANEDIIIEKTALGYDAALKGAAALCINK